MKKARKILNTDIVVMMTPDAYAQSDNLIENLTHPLRNGMASVSYARQIPHKGADFFETFPREFNYPRKSHIRSIKDIKKYGVYSFFCSDSCAAYLNSALEEIGGFPSILTAEDTYVVAKLLKRGHNIAYTADAVVRHSHRYNLKQEFTRHFDTGLMRKQYKDILNFGETDSKRGKQYVKEMIKKIICSDLKMLPYASLHTLAKWFGYKLGTWSINAPIWLRRYFSAQDYYWVSDDFLQQK